MRLAYCKPLYHIRYSVASTFNSSCILTTSIQVYNYTNLFPIHSNHLALILPSLETVEVFGQHQGWFGSERYQREDHHDQACPELGSLDPYPAKTSKLRRVVMLRFSQPHGIKAIHGMAKNPLLKRRRHSHGCCWTGKNMD